MGLLSMKTILLLRRTGVSGPGRAASPGSRTYGRWSGARTERSGDHPGGDGGPVDQWTTRSRGGGGDSKEENVFMLLNYTEVVVVWSTSNHHSSTHSPVADEAHFLLMTSWKQTPLWDEAKEDPKISSLQQTVYQWQEVAPSMDHNCDSFRPKSQLTLWEIVTLAISAIKGDLNIRILQPR